MSHLDWIPGRELILIISDLRYYGGAGWYNGNHQDGLSWTFWKTLFICIILHARVYNVRNRKSKIILCLVFDIRSCLYNVEKCSLLWFVITCLTWSSWYPGPALVGGEPVRSISESHPQLASSSLPHFWNICIVSLKFWFTSLRFVSHLGSLLARLTMLKSAIFWLESSEFLATWRHQSVV